MLTRGRAGLPRRRLPQRRHAGVPGRRRPRVLLHGDEHAPAGRAPGHGGRDGPRPRAPAAARRRRRAAAAQTGRAPMRGHAHRVPHQRRGSRRAASCPRPAPSTRFRPPLGPGVRVDTHVVDGYRVPPNYDSLVAKLVVWDADRDAALDRAPARARRARDRRHPHHRASCSWTSSTSPCSAAASTPPATCRTRPTACRASANELAPRHAARPGGRPGARRMMLLYQRSVTERPLEELVARYEEDAGVALPAYARAAGRGRGGASSRSSTPRSTPTRTAGRPTASRRSSGPRCASRRSSCSIGRTSRPARRSRRRCAWRGATPRRRPRRSSTACSARSRARTGWGGRVPAGGGRRPAAGAARPHRRRDRAPRGQRRSRRGGRGARASSTRSRRSSRPRWSGSGARRRTRRSGDGRPRGRGAARRPAPFPDHLVAPRRPRARRASPCPGGDDDLAPFDEALRYPLLAGGKRLRPVLLLATVEALGGDVEGALPTAVALECVHTFSLVHDDLPALDDDDLRRGRPTVHRVYGEDVAVLVGDALLNVAFRLVAERQGGPAERRLRATATLARAVDGMIRGQYLDVRPERRPRRGRPAAPVLAQDGAADRGRRRPRARPRRRRRTTSPRRTGRSRPRSGWASRSSTTCSTRRAPTTRSASGRARTRPRAGARTSRCSAWRGRGSSRAPARSVHLHASTTLPGRPRLAGRDRRARLPAGSLMVAAVGAMRARATGTAWPTVTAMLLLFALTFPAMKAATTGPRRRHRHGAALRDRERGAAAASAGATLRHIGPVWRKLVLAGVVGLGAQAVFMVAGVDAGSASLGALILGLEPIGIAVCAALVGGEHLDRRTVGALALGLRRRRGRLRRPHRAARRHPGRRRRVPAADGRDVLGLHRRHPPLPRAGRPARDRRPSPRSAACS